MQESIPQFEHINSTSQRYWEDGTSISSIHCLKHRRLWPQSLLIKRQLKNAVSPGGHWLLPSLLPPKAFLWSAIGHLHIAERHILIQLFLGFQPIAERLITAVSIRFSLPVKGLGSPRRISKNGNHYSWAGRMAVSPPIAFQSVWRGAQDQGVDSDTWWCPNFYNVGTGWVCP